jgi:hypothetical protein
MASSSPLRVHTLAYKNKFVVPSKITQTEGTTVEKLRQWVADKLNFPTTEATLISEGRRLTDEMLLSDRTSGDVHLVCTAPTDGSNPQKVKIYIKDTTRVPNKMYCVKMDSTQSVPELKKKLFEKSSCKVPASLQLLTCRGKVVDGRFSLREYIITQRRDRIVFYLSKNPDALDEEELQLAVTVPTDGMTINVRIAAGMTVGNLTQVLQRSHGLPQTMCLLNAAGLVLLDDMTIKHACSMPKQVPGMPVPLPRLKPWVKPGSINLNLFCLNFPREKLLHGPQGVEVFLNPEHFEPLGITNPETRRRQRKGKGKTCAALKGFKGLFTKKEKKVEPKATTVMEAENKTPADKGQPKKPKKKKNLYKSRMKAMMKSTQYASREDEIAQYRRKISTNLGGGQYKRIDSI